MASKDQVMAALKDVMDPELHISIVNLQMVKNVDIQGDNVKVLVALTVGGCPLSKTISTDIEKAVTKLPGVKSVDVTTTVMTKQELEQLRTKIQSQMAAAQSQKAAPGAMPPGINRLERKGVRNVIAIMSGKGGVGKSFVTGFLAVQLTRLGYTVGILDADITGPSMAKMFGLKGPLFVSADKHVLPATTHMGIKVVSMNLILEEPQMPVIARGPIINSVIRQMFQDIEWGDLHFLLVDLPPGCLSADTTVYANSRPVKISQIKPGDHVYSVNARITRPEKSNKLTVSLERKRVVDVVPQGESEVFELRTHSRAVKATFNHPILTLSRTTVAGSRFKGYALTWRKIADLKPRDIIAVVKKLPDSQKSYLLPRAEVKGTKAIRIPRNSSEEFARLVGYFLGDGFLRITPKTRTYQLLFAEPTQGRHRQSYIKLLKQIFGDVPIYEDDQQFGLISRPAVELFRNLGLYRHALDKRVPDWAFELPRAQKLAIIEGYCDADGHRRSAQPLSRRAGWMNFESPNKMLLDDVRTLCIMTGLRVTNLNSRVRSLTPPSGRHYTTKFWSFEASASSRSDKYGAGMIRNGTGQGLIDEHVGFERVTRIAALGRQQVYDLKVEDNENFIADGIIVHNTSDAPLTVFQSLPLQGVVVVTTPQDLALMVVGKAINMAKTLSEQLVPVKILGIIENMSYLICPHCGEKIEVFGRSKAPEAAKKAGIPYLGAVPIDPEIARLADEGKIEDYVNPLFEEVTRAVRLNAARLLEPIPGAMPIAWSEKKSG